MSSNNFDVRCWKRVKFLAGVVWTPISPRGKQPAMPSTAAASPIPPAPPWINPSLFRLRQPPSQRHFVLAHLANPEPYRPPSVDKEPRASNSGKWNTVQDHTTPRHGDFNRLARDAGRERTANDDGALGGKKITCGGRRHDVDARHSSSVCFLALAFG